MFKQGNVVFVTEIVLFCVLFSLVLVFVVLSQVELQHSGHVFFQIVCSCSVFYLCQKYFPHSVMFAVFHSNVGEISVG